MTYAQAINALALAVGVGREPITVADALASMASTPSYQRRGYAPALTKVATAIRSGDERYVASRTRSLLGFL